MKAWKLCLLALVPGVLGWLHNLLLSRALFASLPDFLYPLLFCLVCYLPTLATIVFSLWLGRRCGGARVPFSKYLLCTQWPSAVSLLLYIWQFLLVSDAGRSYFLAALAQCPAGPLCVITVPVVALLDAGNVWAQGANLAATVLSLALLAVLYIAGYWCSRRHQRIGEEEIRRYTR